MNTTSALPPINQALLPANVRNGDAAAKSAYQQGLAFEQVLVSQFAQQLVSGIDGSNGSASSDGSDGSSGSGSTNAAAGMYAQLLPTALTSSMMSAGGLGVAAQLAAAIDPAINDPSKAKQ